jgi:three-Cys-motif partner protein
LGDFLEVQFHSRIKHWLLENYLNICLNVQKRRKKPFYYIDLYSGDGTCECKNPPSRWEGSPIVAIKNSSESKFGFHCVFNDIDPQNIKELKQRLKPYENRDNVLKVFNEDANKTHSNILKLIPSREHSLFFIDPTKHTQLNWSTIENISNHKCRDYYGISFIRRPELMINLMTYTMQIDYQQNPQYIDNFMGLNSKWREHVTQCIGNNEPIHKGFLSAYVNQLKNIYKQDPSFIEIQQTGKGIKKGSGNVVYYLLFVTSHPKARDIICDYFRYVNKYKKIGWAKEYFKLKGYSSIEELK